MKKLFYIIVLVGLGSTSFAAKGSRQFRHHTAEFEKDLVTDDLALTYPNLSHNHKDDVNSDIKTSKLFRHHYNGFLKDLVTDDLELSGEGVTDENGTERCGITVQKIGDKKLHLIVNGAGVVVTAKVNNNDEIEFNAKTEELPSQEVNVFVVMGQDAQPISFQLTTEGEMVECNF